MAASLQEEDIDNELLIEEVEKRPALFIKKLKEYSDINLKRRLWDEILIQLFPTRTLTQEQKENAVKIVQRRWKNLRACFSRELRFQRDVKSGQAAPKRKRYVYFDKLLFLVPSMDQVRETSGNATSLDDNEAFGENESSSSTPTLRVTRPIQEKKNKNKSYEESLLEILKEKNICNTQTDPDTYFALSLVPILKSIPPDQKIDAQIAILNTLKYYTSSSYSRSNYNPTAASYIIPQPQPPRILSQQIISPPQPQPPRRLSQQCFNPSEIPSHDISSPRSNETVQSFVSNYSAGDSDIANFYASE